VGNPLWDEPLDPRIARRIAQGIDGTLPIGEESKRALAAEYSDASFAAPGQGVGLSEDWGEPLEPNAGAATDPIFAAMVEQAQGAAAAAGWTLYETEDGCRGAVRPERIQGHPRAGLIVGNSAAAQRVYLYAAQEAYRRGDRDAAEDVRKCIGAPEHLMYPPSDAFADLRDLAPPYYLAAAICEVLHSDNWRTQGDPYGYLYRAARGALWNQMREDAREIKGPALARLTRVGLDNDAEKWLAARECQRQEELEAVFGRLIGRNAPEGLSPKLCRFLRICLSVAAEDNTELKWRDVARRYGEPEQRLDRFHAKIERLHGDELDLLWQMLGGYLVQHREVRWIGPHRDAQGRWIDGEFKAPPRKSW
jgi:hypothetical protein